MLRKTLRKLRQLKFSYEPLVEITISKSRLIHNLNVFKKLSPGCEVAPVVKSNAYGHGLVKIAPVLDEVRPPFIVADSYYEAMILRNEGVISPILLIGYSSDTNILDSKLKKISFALTSIDQIKEIATKLSKPTNFHIKIDTGMSRQGIKPEEFGELMKTLKKDGVEQNKNFILEGIFSHLADADGVDKTFTEKQIRTWNTAVDIFKKEFPKLRYYHLAATSGTFYNKSITANMIRLGLGLYGYCDMRDASLDLKPVLQMRSIITSVKKIKKGDLVGYNGTFVAPHDMTIATIPAGYFEGVDRRLSNCGSVRVNMRTKNKGVLKNIDLGDEIYNDSDSKMCPIVGRVSMNITTIDVSSLPGAHRGNEVVIISNDPIAKNSAASIAAIAKTVPWEIIVHMPTQVRRTLVA